MIRSKRIRRSWPPSSSIWQSKTRWWWSAVIHRPKAQSVSPQLRAKWSPLNLLISIKNHFSLNPAPFALIIRKKSLMTKFQRYSQSMIQASTSLSRTWKKRKWRRPRTTLRPSTNEHSNYWFRGLFRNLLRKERPRIHRCRARPPPITTSRSWCATRSRPGSSP